MYDFIFNKIGVLYKVKEGDEESLLIKSVNNVNLNRWAVTHNVFMYLGFDEEDNCGNKHYKFLMGCQIVYMYFPYICLRRLDC